ncbi:hypothetical protein B0H13DRAFT_2144171 [Mycena leptocephala]|nr:hypothetical protein B0H13DRAFT_2144171 [Mycena leptocephala]
MESESSLYSTLLFPKRQGYPLFQPQPYDDLPNESKRTGIRIGDVGIVTAPGSFDPIFNILHEDGDQNFVQLELDDRDIAWHELRYPPGSDVSNTSINKRRIDVNAGVEDNVFLPVGAGAEVEVSANSKRTAVLLLPDGASSWDLRALQLFKEYAEKHTQNWYKFVNGTLKRRIANGDLYLVTGVTKSSSWSVAAIEQGSGDTRLSLKLKAAKVAAAGASYAWGRQALEEWKDNQTVFLRGYKAYFRIPRPAMLPKALSVVDSEWSDIRWKGEVVPYSNSSSSRSGTTSISSSIRNVSSQRSPSESVESLSDEVDSLDRVGYHPSRAINEHLLDCAPSATVAITHDDDWASVLNEDDEEMPTRYELIRRISNRFDIAVTELGGVCLQLRTADEDPSEGEDDEFILMSEPSPDYEAARAMQQSPPPYDHDHDLSSHLRDLEHISSKVMNSHLSQHSEMQKLASKVSALRKAMAAPNYLDMSESALTVQHMARKVETTLWDDLPLDAIALAHKKRAESLMTQRSPDDTSSYTSAIYAGYLKYLMLYPYTNEDEYQQTYEKFRLLKQVVDPTELLRGLEGHQESKGPYWVWVIGGLLGAVLAAVVFYILGSR